MSYTNWLPGHPLGGTGFEANDDAQLYLNASSPSSLIQGWFTTTNSANNYVIECGDGIRDTAGNPVPEPSTVLLSAAGLAAVLWRKRAMLAR